MKPSNNPQTMRDGTWYYEDRRGIDVYREQKIRADIGCGDKFTTTSRIPWGRIIKSLERCGHEVRKVKP